MLTDTIDPSSDRAVYKQIPDHLRTAIGRERLREGDQLPSEAQLMAHYAVARMTVRNALRVLEADGLITAEHGRGVYVRARPPVRRLASDRFAQRHRKEGKAAFLAESEQLAATPTVDMIEVSEAAPPDEVADRLKVPDGEPVVVRSRRYSLNGHPVETAVSYIPADLALTPPSPWPTLAFSTLSRRWLASRLAPGLVGKGRHSPPRNCGR